MNNTNIKATEENNIIEMTTTESLTNVTKRIYGKALSYNELAKFKKAADKIMSSAFKCSDGSYMAEVNPKYLLLAGYQRIGEGKMSQIAANFDSRKLAPAMVSYRDGLLYVWDGQNRCGACILSGNKKIMVKISIGLSLEEESYLFATQDSNKKNVSPFAKLNSALISKKWEDEKIRPYLIVDKICDEMNITIKNNIRAPRYLSTLTTSVGIAGRIEEDGFRWIVNILNESGFVDTNTGMVAYVQSALESVYNNISPNERVRASKTLIQELTRCKTAEDFAEKAITEVRAVTHDKKNLDRRYATKMYLKEVVRRTSSALVA